MGFIAWIVFGAIVGWVANVVVGGKYRRPQGCLVSIIVGVVGAALGGLLYRAFTGQEKTWDFDLPSMGVAALGAIVLLAVLQLVQAIARRSSGNRP
ncbi:GlsB/YeaQ/YmgE family stress response membrane protein [Actinophytocola algeriensis]|uniref:Putative membrane protein YeaQ/YmgE (Transglycosylase-associated protein family) n=1 Tax=Actinophytocola algeriensis TaxID=1768010 RepID=A0A7W7Q5T4_9PSEU|nr:GlsB/YeaQ/YmgE family stress response membrane protein [Actinophytocola algeriensis]MBB4907343.1 putative membrane protein YeaQ/YmgE (transglycosylase-associated protein family) [Actinophytocola algeriensis]MBE1478826.1 putative membrane protein YeaQ/YmgE (transglycosylase-associated protein family) [Actinophytocola algeriensis]